VAVLLVEDNARLRATLVRGIQECGFVVDVESTGRGALERLSKNDADAMILDLGLPDIDGLDVLVQARERGLLAPVLVLTARDAIESRVTALDRGADDYLVKPFAFEELVARLRALVRRAAAPRWAPLAFGDLRVEPSSPVALAGSRRISLSPREHALLHYLVRRGSDVSSRREILGEVFGYDFDPGTNVIDVHIAHLRRKLAGASCRIETVRGAGYRLRTVTEGERDDD
jgi:DNA-binding response OmpR family regulator